MRVLTLLLLGAVLTACVVRTTTPPVTVSPPAPVSATAPEAGTALPTAPGGQVGKTPGARATEKAIERASEGRGKKRTTYRGNVAGVGSDSLTLTTSDGQSLTFAVTAGTKINVPGKGVHGALTDLTPGARVMVQAIAGGLDQLMAVHIVLQTGEAEGDSEAAATATPSP